MFRAIEADRDLPAGQVKGTRKGQGGRRQTAAPTVTPAKVHVQVLNGSGVTGIAGTTATALTAKGFTVTGTGPAANYGYTSSVIQYSSASQLPEVNTLKAELGSVMAQQDTALGAGTLNLILGSSFTGLSSRHGRAGQVVRQDARQPGQELRRHHGQHEHLPDSAASPARTTRCPGG